MPESNLLLGVAWHPSGEFALATLNRTKNLVPMTRILQGWTITNGLAVLWRDGRVDQVLLDEPQALLRRRDRRRVHARRHASAGDQRGHRPRGRGRRRRSCWPWSSGRPTTSARDVLPNWLGASAEFVVARVPVKDNPRGIAVAPDGADGLRGEHARRLAQRDRPGRQLRSVARVDLGGPREITHLRWGERLFHSAKITFQRQFACATCHPDGHVDGLTYDIEADGIGVEPGRQPHAARDLRHGPVQVGGHQPEPVAPVRRAAVRVLHAASRRSRRRSCSAVNDYTVTIPRPPNRYRPLGRRSSRRPSAAARLLFERTPHERRPRDPARGPLPCYLPLPAVLHRPPRCTTSARSTALDRQAKFDMPHLNNIYDSAPYLHNGMREHARGDLDRLQPVRHARRTRTT